MQPPEDSVSVVGDYCGNWVLYVILHMIEAINSLITHEGVGHWFS